MSSISEVTAKQQYPELSQLTIMFMEQDWADDVAGSEHMLAVEIVGHMFRQRVDEWLADPALSAAVQAEISHVLAATDSVQSCEEALGMGLGLFDQFGVDIRKVLQNTQWFLAQNGEVIY